jgi:hypothetical protein
MSALRFLYKKTLKRRDIAYEDLIFPKTPQKLPVVLSPEEVTRLIEAAPNVLHRMILNGPLRATGTRTARSASGSCKRSGTLVLSVLPGTHARDRASYGGTDPGRGKQAGLDP